MELPKTYQVKVGIINANRIMFLCQKNNMRFGDYVVFNDGLPVSIFPYQSADIPVVFAWDFLNYHTYIK